MRKIFVLFILALVALAGLPATTQAQNGSYRQEFLRRAIVGDTYGSGAYRTNNQRYGYGGYYDPAYLNQMFDLPESLLACQMNFGNKTVEKCHALLKTIDYMEGHAVRHEDLNELLGTVRIYKQEPYFCAFDDTDHRIGRAGVIAASTGGGAAVGGAIGGRKGAAIGGVGAFFASWWASRKSNNVDKCLHVVGQPQAADITSAATIAPASFQQGQGQQQPVAGQTVGRDESYGPAYQSGSYQVANASRVYVEIYDGDKKPENFVGTLDEGDSLPVARPRNRYRAWAQMPNEQGGLDIEELGIEVSAKGWTFIEPEEAR